MREIKVLLLLRNVNSLREALTKANEVEYKLIQTFELIDSYASQESAVFTVKGSLNKMSKCLVDISKSLDLIPGSLSIEPAMKMESESSSLKKKRVRVFDLFSVRGKHGEKYFIHYLNKHPEYNHLVRCYIEDELAYPLLIDLINSKPLFPPVFSYLNPSVIEAQQLTLEGNFRIEFEYPRFKHNTEASITENINSGIWSIWTFPDEYQPVQEVTEDLKNLEYLLMWPIQDIIERMEKRLGPRDLSKMKLVPQGICFD